MTLGQVVEIGPFHFTVIRILVALGVCRVFVRQERISGGLKPLDKAMIGWATWGVLCSFLHQDVLSTLVNRLGLVYDGLGLYFLLRVFIEGVDGVRLTAKIVLLLLAPVALEMVYEHFTGRDNFAIFGGVAEFCEVRGGKVRANGPFAHSILAGTVGAVCLPLAFLFWKEQRKLCLLGMAATGAIVATSSSSGPILTTMFVMLGLAAWKIRNRMRMVRWGALLLAIVLNEVMEAPVYYLLARIDLTGSSTGWHRAELIHAAITHLNEWWLAGTDYTRHWIAYGVAWSENHADITNHYIKMGVLGGMPLMLLFIYVLVVAFRTVGVVLRGSAGESFERRFMIWTLGAILFGHAATWMSISYFDQTVVFLYMVLAAIGSLTITPRPVVEVEATAPIKEQAA